MPRYVFEQVGGFDDSFDMPGGGYANLELYERLHAHPEITPASVLGEGTFHQFHGGTTTNVSDEAVRRARIFAYGEHFRDTRGRGLLGLNKPVHYVGSMDTKAARRTRSRREFLLAFRADRDPVSTTDTTVLPVPEELKLAAIEALWEQQAWRETTWLGHRVARYPTDLHSYQELLSQVRPEVVVVARRRRGPRRPGPVRGVGDRPARPRPRCWPSGGPGPASGPSTSGSPTSTATARSPEVVAQVAGGVGAGTAVVFVGLGASARVVAAFEAYAPLVAVDSYVVIENTVVNGCPVASSFGPGPHEAVNDLLRRHRDFVPDVAFERYTVTFNKNGFLRRMAEA